ncbi:MAG: hypothetical protein EPN93_12435 [Spirochaetes bacterium]|nr:MAG: hypothetical protein EPN93_12435 [Spirochaetota bacterium]
MPYNANMEAVITPPSLPFTRKLGYAIGNPACNICYQVVNLFLLYFYTDVFGITGAVAGIIFLVARIIDAAVDPMVGYIADQTNTRWGKFRPYVLFGAPILCLFFALTFITPDLSPSLQVAYAFATYISFGILYSIVNIPFNSLAAAITQNTNERNSLAAIGLVLTQVAVVAVAIITRPAVKLFSSEAAGFGIMVSIYAAIALSMFMVSFSMTKEAISPTGTGRYNLQSALHLVTRNKYLLLLAGAYLASGIAGTVRSFSAIYFFKYNAGDENLFGPFMLVQVLGALPASALTPMIAAKLQNKRNLFIIGILIFIFGDFGVLLMSYSNPALFFLFNFIIGIGGGITMVLTWSMLPDTIEYGEWKTGIRGAGITYSAFSFVAKVAAAVGGGLAGAILTWAGYTPNVAQPDFVKDTILHMLALFPLIAGIIGLILLSFYRIDNRFFARMVREIAERRG